MHAKEVFDYHKLLRQYRKDMANWVRLQSDLVGEFNRQRQAQAQAALNNPAQNSTANSSQQQPVAVVQPQQQQQQQEPTGEDAEARDLPGGEILDRLDDDNNTDDQDNNQ
jgi:hypothetical protein